MQILLIAILGFAGANLRYLVTQWMGAPAGFPIATLAINLSGCAFLGWFYTITLYRVYIHPSIRLAVGTGFVGAFTTFSTFAIELWRLSELHKYDTLVAYFGLSVLGGCLCAAAGVALGLYQSTIRVY